MKAKEFQGQYYSPENDRYSQATVSDERKPKITLMHLNKLKKMRAAKDLEDLVHADNLEIQYAPPAEGAV
jgi:hypothetical protein